MSYCFLSCSWFSYAFLRFSLDFCKGRISKNTLQIALTAQNNPSLIDMTCMYVSLCVVMLHVHLLLILLFIASSALLFFITLCSLCVLMVFLSFVKHLMFFLLSMLFCPLLHCRMYVLLILRAELLLTA